MREYFICPNCEARVAAGALACQECGADEQAGWSSAPDDALDDPRDLYVPSLKGQQRWLRWGLITMLAVLLSSYLLLALTWGLYLVPFVLLGLGFFFYLSRDSLRGEDAIEHELYATLLSRARGDEQLVERLLEQERRRSPGSSAADQLRAAIYRWERDGG